MASQVYSKSHSPDCAIWTTIRLFLDHPSFSSSLSKVSLKTFSPLTWRICTRRADKLYRARSRLYQSHILQANIHVKALAEIYTIHFFAQLSKHIVKHFQNKWLKLAGTLLKYGDSLLTCCYILTGCFFRIFARMQSRPWRLITVAILVLSGPSPVAPIIQDSQLVRF